MYDSEKRKLLENIPEDIYEILKEQQCFVAGGAITSLFTNRKINDIDVYFRSQEHLRRAILSIFEKTSFSLVCINYTDKSILFTTLGNPENAIKVQFIHFRYFDSLEDLFKSFDFTICMGGFDLESETFYFDGSFFKHNSQRYLKYNTRTDFPLLSALRVDKYKDRGYEISKAEFMRVAINVAKLNMDSWESAKEHIGGMYGLEVERLFDETAEFSIEGLLKQLNNVTDKQVQTRKPAKGVFLTELLYSILGATPRFYKYVKETNDGLYSRMRTTDSLKYVVGETVNGGEKGIFCATPEMNNYHLTAPARQAVLVELEPDGRKWSMDSHEAQLFGDVWVKRIADPSELKNPGGIDGHEKSTNV